jgi:hypothetical protein
MTVMMTTKMKIASGTMVVLRMVENLIDDGIGKRVLLARNVPDVDVLEAAQERLRTAVERLKIRVLYAVFAAHLFDDELGIHTNREATDPAFGGALEPDAERRPFGDVVRCPAKKLADLVQYLAVGRHEDRTACGGPGISAGATVREKGCFGGKGIKKGRHGRLSSFGTGIMQPCDTL